MKKMNVLERAEAPTPNFFKKLRTVGLILATVGSCVLTAPVTLPATVITIAGYLTVAAGVLTAVSQVTVDEQKVKEKGGKNE